MVIPVAQRSKLAIQKRAALMNRERSNVDVTTVTKEPASNAKVNCTLLKPLSLKSIGNLTNCYLSKRKLKLTNITKIVNSFHLNGHPDGKVKGIYTMTNYNITLTLEAQILKKWSRQTSLLLVFGFERLAALLVKITEIILSSRNFKLL